MLGRGPALFGHTPTAINEAVALAVANGSDARAGDAARGGGRDAALSVIPWADRLRFITSGTEAVQAAFRLARAATGRPLVRAIRGALPRLARRRSRSHLVTIPARPTPRPRARPSTAEPRSCSCPGMIPSRSTPPSLSGVDRSPPSSPSRSTSSVEPLPSTGFLSHLRDVTSPPRRGARSSTRSSPASVSNPVRPPRCSGSRPTSRPSPKASVQVGRSRRSPEPPPCSTGWHRPGSAVGHLQRQRRCHGCGHRHRWRHGRRCRAPEHERLG